MSGRISCIFLLLLPVLMPEISRARTWLVCPDGSGDVPTIQAAIDSVTAADVIELTDGIFTGDGCRDLSNLEKAIVIRSQSGNPDACVIDCQGSADAPHTGIAFYGGG